MVRVSKQQDRYMAAAADLADTLDKLTPADFVPLLAAWAAIVDVDPHLWYRWVHVHHPALVARHKAAIGAHKVWQWEQYRAGRAAGRTKMELHKELGLPIKDLHKADPTGKAVYDWPGLFVRHRKWLAEPRRLADVAKQFGVPYNTMSNRVVRRQLPPWVGLERVGMPMFLWDKKAHKGPSHADR